MLKQINRALRKMPSNMMVEDKYLNTKIKTMLYMRLLMNHPVMDIMLLTRWRIEDEYQ